MNRARATRMAAILAALSTTQAAEGPAVTVAPAVVMCQRPGITGAGWAVVHEFPSSATGRKIVSIFPMHPDDWKSTGTGMCWSGDDGATWQAAPDHSPFAGMVDMWQDRLRDGELVTFGIRSVPEREKVLSVPANAAAEKNYLVGISKNCGQTWERVDAVIHCPMEIGVIARPLPHILEDDRGGWLMPAYSWGKSGTRALLLESADRGRNWSVRSTIATTEDLRKAGAQLSTPWLETAVVRARDGSLLAAMRTGSGSESPIVTARSADGGSTWSPTEKLLAGPERQIVAGKLPSLLLLPNGALALLTAHTKRGCFLYLSRDGTGHDWSEGHLITDTTGGNTSMVALSAGTLLVFTPANGRINCWRVTLR